MSKEKHKIVFCLKGQLESLPPLISVIRVAAEARPVALICDSLTDQNKSSMDEAGIQVVARYLSPPKLQTGRSTLRKISDWQKFRAHFLRAVQNDAVQKYYWICGADTWIALQGAFDRRRALLHMYEMYDQNRLYSKILAMTAGRAKSVVAAEFARACIAKYQFGLPRVPSVVPNYPVTLNCELSTNRERAGATLSAVEELVQAGKRVCIYQGHIAPDRPLDALITSFARYESWAVVLMGHSHGGYAERLCEQHTNCVYVGHVPAPYHLIVTALASVGILYYDYTSLNNIFCAPNKIWEYGSQGVAMLANDLPGLRGYVTAANAGVLFDPFAASSIDAAVDDVIQNAKEYGEGARKMYETHDHRKLINTIIGEFAG